MSLRGRLHAARRWAASLRGERVATESQWIVSEGGWKLSARVLRPARRATSSPAVLLIPGLGATNRVFARWRGPLNEHELAQRGCLTLALDLSGRGRSWGNEDYGGPAQQGDVRAALRYLKRRPDVDADRIGVISLSLGCAAVGGALADMEPIASWWVDWEGPSDREIITAGGRRMEPALGHALDDEAYWRPREAVRHVGEIGIPYLRYQGIRDHAQPGELRHAERMIIAAAEGDLPWFQLNDHPRNQVPYTPRWMPDRPGTAPAWIVRTVSALHGLSPP